MLLLQSNLIELYFSFIYIFFLMVYLSQFLNPGTTGILIY